MHWILRPVMLFLSFTIVKTHAQYEQPVVYSNASFANLELKSPANGKNLKLGMNQYPSDYMLFIFLSPECPLSQQYSLSLNEIAKTYAEHLTLIGIFPGKSYDRKTINEFLKKYKISFPTYIDESKKLTRLLAATVTPEVILFNHQPTELQLLYRGAIDDRVKELGVKRLKATNYFLKNAIEQSLRKTDVVIKKTEPVGCLINDY